MMKRRKLNWKDYSPAPDDFAQMASARASHGVGGRYQIHRSIPTNAFGRRNGPDHFDVRYCKGGCNRFVRSTATLEEAKKMAEADNEHRALAK